MKREFRHAALNRRVALRPGRSHPTDPQSAFIVIPAHSRRSGHWSRKT